MQFFILFIETKYIFSFRNLIIQHLLPKLGYFCNHKYWSNKKDTGFYCQYLKLQYMFILFFLQHRHCLNMPRAWLINYTFLTNCCAKHFLLHFPNQHKCTLVFIMAYYCQILVINHNSNISLVCGKVNAGFHLKPPPHKLNFNTYSFI